MGKIYALLVPVGDYQKLNTASLKTYKMDFNLIAYALKNGLKVSAENIRILGTNGFVAAKSLGVVLKTFSGLLTEEDTFIFYFSGHGQGANLIFSDCAVGLSGIINYIEKLPAKNKLILLDCCYSGTAQTGNVKSFSMQDTLNSFVGHGTAVLASSATDEKSWMGENGNHSLFTGITSSVLLNKNLIHKGQISLQDIVTNVREYFAVWNEKHPDRKQQPIYRASLGGTIYFPVEEYHAYQPAEIHMETDRYIIDSVKPLSTQDTKRLAVFVISSHDVAIEELPDITKEIAEKIRFAEVFSSEQSLNQMKGLPARLVMCYFGHDKSDLVRGLHYAYTVWTDDEQLERKFFRKNKNASVKNGIYLYINSSYDMLRKLQASDITVQEYEEQIKLLYSQIISKAELFISSISALENNETTIEEIRNAYGQWISSVYRLYYKLTDAPVAPDDIHDWAESVLDLAGYVMDMSLFIRNEKGKENFGERKLWLIKNAIRHYYESLERLKDFENEI